ncbi:hypothetical protein JD77_06027 [Micromonospora olivasterospora]|uniref:Uncharacterized protein n=1 Tax=Micromonospora olivasterospora TaxID=1880 RepID=A0A562IJE4_MICOL|nr:hypothetical protein JD77_06027 [Micromonospora olivasterospora]
MIVRVCAMCAAAPTGFQNHIAAATANSAIMKLNMANAVRLPTSVSTKNFFSASTTASIRSAVSAIFLTNGAVCATNRSKASPSPACRTALIVCSSNGPSTVRTRSSSVSNVPMSCRNNGSSARDTLIPVNASKARNQLSLSSRVATAAANAQHSPPCPETGAPSANQSAALTAHPSPDHLAGDDLGTVAHPVATTPTPRPTTRPTPTTTGSVDRREPRTLTVK